MKDTMCKNGLSYVRSGGYYVPNLELPEEPRPIGRWGRMHRDYLKQAHPVTYSTLMLSGKMGTLLADLNEQAEERLERIVKQMCAAEGVTEELKVNDQMEWVRRMNNIRVRAEEIIQAEMIETE